MKYVPILFGGCVVSEWKCPVGDIPLPGEHDAAGDKNQDDRGAVRNAAGVCHAAFAAQVLSGGLHDGVRQHVLLVTYPLCPNHAGPEVPDQTTLVAHEDAQVRRNAPGQHASSEGTVLAGGDAHMGRLLLARGPREAPVGRNGGLHVHFHLFGHPLVGGVPVS